MRKSSIDNLFLSFLMFLPSIAFTQSYSPDANPQTVKSISVNIYDDSTGACWTNLREVREYAEEKLTASGYKVDVQGGNYDFDISVNAFRISNINTSCVGSYQVEIVKLTSSEGMVGYHKIGNIAGVVTRHKDENLNRDVLEAVNDMIGTM